MAQLDVLDDTGVGVAAYLIWSTTATIACTRGEKRMCGGPDRSRQARELISAAVRLFVPDVGRSLAFSLPGHGGIVAATIPAPDGPFYVGEIGLHCALIHNWNTIPLDTVGGIALGRHDDLAELGRHLALDLLAVNKELSDAHSLAGMDLRMFWSEVDSGFLLRGKPASTLTERSHPRSLIAPAPRAPASLSPRTGTFEFASRAVEISQG